METRVVKNVCAPAAAIGDQIIIVGGKGTVSPSLLPAHAQILQDFTPFLFRMPPVLARDGKSCSQPCWQ